MKDFTFSNRTHIIFGKNAYEHLIPELDFFHARRLLLHYGGQSAEKNGLLKKLRRALDERSLPYIELSGVRPNPRLSLVREGIGLCKKHQIDFILAVGGGSVIDSAKAIAAGACLSPNEDVCDYYLDNSKVFADALPVGVVLTLPAAGSESSCGSVVTNEASRMKRSAECKAMVPVFALMNPEITYTLPAYQTACGASDIIAHMMERYFTQVSPTDLTDRLIEGAIKTILNTAPKALRSPEDYDARAEIMWTGTLAHNGLLDTGRLGDWGSHMIEHELSGFYDIAHGAGLSIIFPAWMRYVCHENIYKFVQFAQRVFDVELDYSSLDAIVSEMIRRLESFYQALGLPTRLSQVGIGDEHFREMAESALVNREYLGNFKKLYADDIVNILWLAL